MRAVSFRRGSHFSGEVLSKLKPISSQQNPRLKNAVKLRSRRGREQQDRFLIDGFRELKRCIEKGIRINEVFVCRDWIKDSDLAELELYSERDGFGLFDLAPQPFAKLAYGDRSDGVVSTAFRFALQLDALPLSENPLLAVVESLEKPGNLGAILRTADACGADAAIHVSPRTDWFNHNAIRASTGAVFTVPCCDAEWEEASRWLRAQRLNLFVARPDAERLYTEVDYRAPCAVILGNEAEGLSERWNARDVTPIKIPMLGVVDSLNVSVTAAIILFEARRQRDAR